MPRRPHTIERAFELAQSGRVLTLSDLREALKREGFHDGRMHTDGHSIRRQLGELMAHAARRNARGVTA